MKSSNSREGKLSEILAELKAEYRSGFPRKLKKLRETLAKGDLDLLREEFHKLKGTGKTYGYPEVSVLCEVMEFACQDRRADLPTVEKAIVVLDRMQPFWAADTHFDLKSDRDAQTLLALGKGSRK